MWMDVVICQCYTIDAADKADAIRKAMNASATGRVSDKCVFNGTHYDVTKGQEPELLTIETKGDDDDKYCDTKAGWYGGNRKHTKEQDYISFDRTDDI